MYKFTVTQNFENFTDKAIQQIVDTCKGKPAYGGDSKTVIGTIVSAKVVANKCVEFVVEMEVNVL